MSGCEIHGDHRPEPITLHTHHIQPLGMLGPNIPSNKVRVCPTGHFNIHAVLAALVFGHDIPRSSRHERHLAEVGFQMWVDAGRPGSPHAAYGIHPSGE